MGRTNPEQIKDLEKELKLIAELPNIKQKSPGLFYYKSTPFLHFHIGEDGRFADIKIKTGNWVRIEVKTSATARAAFLKAALKAHKTF